MPRNLRRARLEHFGEKSATSTAASILSLRISFNW
jgi:hypothetical protein